MDGFRHDRWSRHAGVRWNPLALVIPAPQFVIPAKAGIQRGGVAPTTPEHFQQPGLIFIPWCAAASRHERLVRKCALQSTSMPALHGRNVPNCRPMAEGGMRKCSAGACPPQGSGWGSAESTVPIRCTKPQLPIFIPWCAGTTRHERLVRKHVPDSVPGWTVPATRCVISAPPHRHSRESGNPEEGLWVAQMTLERFPQPAPPILISWCAGASLHERLVGKHVPDSDPGWIPARAGDTNHRRPNNHSRRSKERCSAGARPQPGEGWEAQTTPELFRQPAHLIFISWCAGDSGHERLVGKHVPDYDPGWTPARAGDTNHRRPNNHSRRSKERCSAGACPQPGEGWEAQTTPEPFHQPTHPIFIPWCAGDSGHEPFL